MFVRTYAPFRAGEHARIRWKLPGVAGEVQADAVVRWNRERSTCEGKPPGMGVQFTATSMDVRDIIRAFLGESDSDN